MSRSGHAYRHPEMTVDFTRSEAEVVDGEARTADGNAAASCQEGAGHVDAGVSGKCVNPTGLHEASAMGSWQRNDAMEHGRNIEMLQGWQGNVALEELRSKRHK